MRRFAVVAWIPLLAGCWLSYEAVDDTGDGDADADADADSDGDGDGDSDPPEGSWWPTQVCGLDGLTPGTGGTLRVMVLTCGGAPSCTAEVVGDAIDLRPTNAFYYGGDRGGEGADCSPGPAWADCEIPAGAYSRLTVWGEPLYVPCFGGDTGDCEAPDCVQLPPDRLPDGCVLQELYAEQVCGPATVWPTEPASFSVTNGCQCPASFRPGGCLSSMRDGVVHFTALVAQCSECGDEDVCFTAETQCGLYEPPPGELTLDFASGVAPITFPVSVGAFAGNVECHGAYDEP